MSAISPAIAASIAIEAAIRIIAAYKRAGLVSQEYLDKAIADAEARQDDVVSRIKDSFKDS